jgi:hypothetical protein
MTQSDLTLIREKHAQLDALLPQLEADAWVVFCREGSDRSTLLFARPRDGGPPAFLFTPAGGRSRSSPTTTGWGSSSRGSSATSSPTGARGSRRICAPCGAS